MKNRLEKILSELNCTETDFFKHLSLHGWYAQELMELYLEFGTYRALAKEVKIPYNSCYYTVKITLGIIKLTLTAVEKYKCDQNKLVS